MNKKFQDIGYWGQIIKIKYKSQDTVLGSNEKLNQCNEKKLKQKNMNQQMSKRKRAKAINSCQTKVGGIFKTYNKQ